MATIEKKYLDLAGLTEYDKKIKEVINGKVDKDATTEVADLGAYKIKVNKDGLVVGTAALTYDDIQGTPDVDSQIGKGELTLKVNGTQIGTFNANAKEDKEINIALGDLGLASAMRFIGTSTTDPYTGATVEGYDSFQAGDVILYNTKEFVYNGAKWIELGDEGSHALNTITITGTDGLTGGGNLTENRTISHAVSDGAEINNLGAYKIKTDKFGHVVGTAALGASAANNGAHTHTVSVSVDVPEVSATSKKLAITKTADTDFVTGVTATTSKLAQTSITPAVAGGTIVPAVAVADDDRPTKTVYSEVTASKAVAGTALTYGSADKAAEATIVGNANVATVATTVGNANVGTAAAVAVSVKEANKNVYDATYDETTECLQLTPVTLQTANITQAVASTNSIYGAVASTDSIYGAVSSTKTFTPYTFEEVTAANITANTAVSVAKAGTAVSIAKVGTAVTVATGGLSASATGDALVTGLTPATAKAVTDVALNGAATTGIDFVTAVASKDKTVTATGTAASAGDHTHTITIE